MNPALNAESFAGRPVSMMVMLGILALLPFAAVALSSFAKVTVVLSIARSALGTQQAPPTIVLTALAAVLSAHIMAPVLEQTYEASDRAYRTADSGADWMAAAKDASAPLKGFLVKHAGAEERAHFVEMARELRTPETADSVSENDLAVIVPAFLVTELKEAFQIGFLIFLPFLILDMVIANILLALGMQTLSPSQVSLPFKLLLFVAVDGWALLAKGLVLGYR